MSVNTEFLIQSFPALGPVCMKKNTSPARPGPERRGKFQSMFI